MRMSKYFLILSIVLPSIIAAPARAGEGDVVAIFEINGPLKEAPDQSGLGELFGDKAPTTMFDLLEKLRTARADENLKAVIFDLEEATLGFAQIQELREQFEALRAADKDVWVFTETLSTGRLALASAASQLILVPTGEVDFRGLYGEGSYYKNMMDKIGVEADILHCGDYKSAGEPFYRTGPSKESEEQTNRLLDSIYDEVIAAVSKSRHLEPEKVRELVDIGTFSAKDALEAKLVDKLAYREDFVKMVKKRYGADTKIERKYGKKKGPEVDFENPFAIFKLFGEMMKGPKQSDKPAIAVVYVEGPITGGKSESGLFGGSNNAGSTTVRAAIAKAAADENVKALILRVDSPGGSAIASDIISEGTKRFKKSGRPFIVSMGNVAGSGGYYVATLADTIFAEPATITGSIGVVGGKIVTKGLWDWVGITGHEFKRGKHADIMNTNRKFSDDERAVVSKMMNRVYEEFKARVKEGRGDHIKGDLEPLAGGRVYTGKQALEIGLVDRLGGFADAIKYAAGEAELGGDYELKVFPKPKNILDMFAEALGGKEEDDNFVSLKAAGAKIGAKFAGLPTIATGLEALSKVDPMKARALQNFLIQMELLSNEGVLLVGPPCLEMMP